MICIKRKVKPSVSIEKKTCPLERILWFGMKSPGSPESRLHMSAIPMVQQLQTIGMAMVHTFELELAEKDWVNMGLQNPTTSPMTSPLPKTKSSKGKSASRRKKKNQGKKTKPPPLSSDSEESISSGRSDQSSGSTRYK